MLRLLRSGLLFAAAVVVLYLGCMWLLVHIPFGGRPAIYRVGDYYKWKGGQSVHMWKDFDPKEHYDVLVLGSSHAYRGYDPAHFAERGLRMFNMGSTAQTPMNSYHLLKAYGTKAHTDAVVLDIYDNTMDVMGMECASDLLLAMPNDEVIHGMLASTKDIRAVNLATLRILGRNIPPLWEDSTYVADGYSRTADSLKKQVNYNAKRPLKIRHEQLEYLAKIIALCKERGIRLVLATHFYPSGTRPERHAPFKAQMDSLLAGTGVPYFDFSYGHGANDRDHFFDANHLNAAGVQLFNERLLDSLEGRGWMGRAGN
jgi:hypothetical protein